MEDFGEFKAILRGISRLTVVYENKDKSNGARRPFMWKSIHDSSSRDTVRVIKADQWSSNKDMMHPTRSEINII